MADEYIIPETDLLKNLMVVARSRPEDAAFINAVEAQARQAGRPLRLRERPTGFQYLGDIISGGTTLGETAGRFGLPPDLSGGPRTIRINTAEHTAGDASRGGDLARRNVLVQSFLDTLRHELGHASDAFTPGYKRFSPRFQEDVASTIGGQQQPTSPEVAARVQQLLSLR